MTAQHNSTGKADGSADEPVEPNQPAKTTRPEALPERLLRTALERAGDAVDRKLGRTIDPKCGLTLSRLIKRTNLLIDQRVRDEEANSRIERQLPRLNVEVRKSSEAPQQLPQD